MKPARVQRWLAFTLIELLVVIAIIGILAALLLPAAKGVFNKSVLNRVQGEVGRLKVAIEAYQTDKGFYPPDNRRMTGNVVSVLPFSTPLYYELTGARVENDRTTFTVSDGAETVTADRLFVAFGTRGINNASIAGASEGPVSKNYLPDLKPNQYATVNFGGAGPLKVLRTEVDGPALPAPFGTTVNAFRYVSSNPTNNTETFDLWVEVEVGGRAYRISNWSDQPEKL